MSRIGIIARDNDLVGAVCRVLSQNANCEIVTLSDRELQPDVDISKPPQLLVVDLPSLSQSVSHFFENLSLCYPDAIVLVLAPSENLCAAETLWPFGVDDVLICPSDESQRYRMMDRLLQKITAFNHLLALQERLWKEMRQSQIVAKSKAMREIIQRFPQLAASMSTVLITGETGTGKELFARAIHYLGPRAGQPFITVDCGAMPDHLVENELFGHARGAYTDAGSSAKGLLQEADGGTLFLDEVETLPLAVQAKFLRFVQERQYKPLGQPKYVSVNVRILAATNIDLAEAVSQKNFREDLYYRLNVVPLFIPPLRERKADIPALVRYFFKREAAGSQTPAEIPDETLQGWLAYHWPGNVRELENKVQEWLALMPADDWRGAPTLSSPIPENIRPLVEVRNEALARCDRAYLQNLLKRTQGNLSAAARLAGIHRKSLLKILRRYQIDVQLFRKSEVLRSHVRP